jgi:hypothetical protein
MAAVACAVISLQTAPVEAEITLVSPSSLRIIGNDLQRGEARARQSAADMAIYVHA